MKDTDSSIDDENIMGISKTVDKYLGKHPAGNDITSCLLRVHFDNKQTAFTGGRWPLVFLIALVLSSLQSEVCSRTASINQRGQQLS